MATQFNESENPHWRRTFFPVWIGQAISLIGSRLVGFALVWYLTETTGSAIILTTISLIGLLPEMILAPFAGALADRWNRKKVLIIADSAIALTTLLIALLFALDVVEIWHIYILMFMRSIGGAFHYPAMSASTSLMVPKERLIKIQGLNQLLNSILMIIAAPLGALALELMEIGNVLFIDVFTAGFAIIILFFITIPQPDITTSEEQKANPMRTMFKDVGIGFKYVVTWKGLFYILLLVTIINALLVPAFSLMPLLVKDTFSREAASLAILQTSLGIGMLLGSLLLSAWGGFKNKINTSAVGLLGVGVGILIMAFAPTHAFWLVVVGGFIFGLANPIVNGPIEVILQETVQPNMQARVFALASTASGAASPIGLALAGPLSEYFGVQSWWLVGGIVCIVMVVIIFTTPAIQNVEKGHPDHTHQSETGVLNTISAEN